MNYSNKIIDVQQAIKLVKSNDMIVSGMMGAEGRLFLSHLHEIDKSVNNVSVTNCLPILEAPFITNPKFAKRFNVDSIFFSSVLRKSKNNGSINYFPTHLHLCGVRRLEHGHPNIFIGACSMIDHHGYVSLSISNVYEKRIIEEADLVILEMNPNFPRTFGDVEVHVSQVDYFIKADYPVPELIDSPITEKDRTIGQHIANLINDGDCIQLGIGGIPNAVADALVNKKDLGVHTEMLTTGFMRLYKAGAITNNKKRVNRGKMVCSFAFGTRELYEFLHDNPGVLFFDCFYVNDPNVIAQNDNQVSINATLEIDLTGQCCSESIGPIQFSGTGGQTDTSLGAQKSKNGRSFIALHSTASVKNQTTGNREVISKIVPTLKAGANVTLSRNDVDYVVTEYGAVRLKGLNVSQRVEKLISIAHPSFRKKLLNQAKQLGIY
jgi:acyl-CoA hydrolase